MPIVPPVGVGSLGLGAIKPIEPIKPKDPIAETGAADFASKVTGALDQLDAMQRRTDRMAEAAATGDLQSVADYMVAATETQLTTQLTVAVRNRAVESFNEIMRMQV